MFEEGIELIRFIFAIEKAQRRRADAKKDRFRATKNLLGNRGDAAERVLVV